MTSLLQFSWRKREHKFGANESDFFHLLTPPKGSQNDKPNILQFGRFSWRAGWI